MLSISVSIGTRLQSGRPGSIPGGDGGFFIQIQRPAGSGARPAAVQ
jgi:hypothetical protein